MKAWEQAETGEVVTPTVSYLNRHFTIKGKTIWDNSPEGVIRSFESVAAG